MELVAVHLDALFGFGYVRLQKNAVQTGSSRLHVMIFIVNRTWVTNNMKLKR